LRAQGERRTWIIQYRIKFKQRRLTIGDAEKLDADGARKIAKDKLADTVKGIDPAQEKQAERDRAGVTLRSVIDLYLKARQPELRPISFKEIERNLTKYWRPLHAEPIDAIARAKIAAELRKIVDNHGPIAAARCRIALSSLYTWALKEGLSQLDDNPVTFTNDPGKGAKARERVLTDAELAAVWNACGDDEHGIIIRLLILTGQRRDEVGSMSWPELEARPKWRIPGARTKNHRDHELTLPALAWDIIDGVPRRHGNQYLFGRKHGYTSWSPTKHALDQRSGVTGWTVHDLRRTVATRMADLEIATLPHVIEALLNHVSGFRRGVAGVYNRSRYEREIRNALAAWADHIRAISTGGERRIVSFPAPGRSGPAA
jgi:integrase